jgi:hypothetical protein
MCCDRSRQFTRFIRSWLAWALLLLPALSAASDTPVDTGQTDTDEPEMQVVLVRGVQPGPALWKVKSGDHVMWLLGEISPYPRKVKWRSKDFVRLLADSQELLIDFSGYWFIDDDSRAALTKAEKLPPGSKLEDVISPELHARLTAAANKFGNPELGQWYPFSAANRLVSAAMKKLGMESFSVRFEAARLGEWHKTKVTPFATPEISFEQRLRNWQQPSNEVCLERLLDAIEDGGNGVLQLANAWSVGSISALRELVPLYSFSRDGFRAGECADAMHGGEQQAREYKLRRTQFWLDEAERALKQNRSTMAVVLMSELFEPDGYLAALRAKGYEVTEPR